MRAISYGRQSKARDDDSAGSPVAQAQSTAAYITARGWEHIHHVEDIGASGYDPQAQRPGLDALLALVRRREVDVVVVYRLDRLTRRGVVEAVRLVGELNDHGVALVSVSEPFLDTTTPMGRGIFALFAAMAEQESANIQQRTKATKAVLRAAGSFAGGQRPYGLEPHRVTEGNLSVLHLRPHPDEAPVIQEVIKRVLDGASVAGEARRLNAEGITTSAGKEWGTSTLIRLLRHPVLAGYSASVRGDVFRDEAGQPLRPWEGVVDPGTWHALQQALSTRGAGRGPLRPEATLLGGSALLRCAHCGSRMAGDRRGEGRGSYRCARHRRGSAQCSGAAISMPHLDRYVTDEVFGRFMTLDEDVAADRAFLRAVAQRFNDAHEDPEAVSARANGEAALAEALASLNRLDDDRAAGIYDGPTGTERFRRLSASLSERVDAARAHLASLPSPASGDDLDGVLALRESLRQGDYYSVVFHDVWTLDERRDFLALFLDRITVTKGIGHAGGNHVTWKGSERVTLEWAAEERPF